jgi:opacity protein-like surface antigen
MGRIDRHILYWVLALLLPTGAALAADMPETPYMSAPTPYEFGSGWYLRGDIGYKIYGTPDAHFDIAGFGDMRGEGLSNTGLAGLGFGYKWNDWFRTDLTVDYEWPGHFHGQLNCPSPCTAAPGQEFSSEFANISAWTTLINTYVDLPLFAEGPTGLTPYVGAGVGASYVTTSNVHFINPGGTTGIWGGGSKWNLAWALTAGISYGITKNTAIDLNYRYVNLGDAISAPTSPVFRNQPLHYDNIDASEVRIGLRYLLN